MHTAIPVLDILQRQSAEAVTYQANWTYKPNSTWQSNLVTEDLNRQSDPFEKTKTEKDCSFGQLSQSYIHNTDNLKKWKRGLFSNYVVKEFFTWDDYINVKD